VKQIEVQIMGQGYVLGCPEGGETRLGQAVAKVDEAMCKIRDAGKIKARDRIAVLAALNLAFDLTDRPAAAAVQASGDSSASSTDLHNLLQRMDAVLARDNQLI
jgi:cell division protein ZapA